MNSDPTTVVSSRSISIWSTRASRQMKPETIPIGLLPGAPRLFVDYVTDFPRVRDLFEHDFRDREAFVGAARAAVSRELPREEVANVLTVQNRLFGSGDRALGNIERLR